MSVKHKLLPMPFAQINQGFNKVFKPHKLSVGLVVPIEEYSTHAVPTMYEHVQRVQQAEALGFSAVWLRDVPFNVPAFGDAGQIFDPFVYLGLLAGQTSKIALGVASLVLPLRHPAHVAKAAASVDQLSNGRLILGVASGDRPEEYPAMGISYQQRSEMFRESYAYIRCMGQRASGLNNSFGQVSSNIELLPKPKGGRLPLLITGSSQQSPSWLADNGDGWITYPRPLELQKRFIKQLRANSSNTIHPIKPVMEPLYIDITDDPKYPPEAIHLGYRLGVDSLKAYLQSRQAIGVDHVALNLRFNQSNVQETLQNVAENVLPSFIHEDEIP